MSTRVKTATTTMTVRYKSPPLTYQRTLDYGPRARVKIVAEEATLLGALNDVRTGRMTYYGSDEEFLDSLTEE